jgi:hypothetical protein
VPIGLPRGFKVIAPRSLPLDGRTGRDAVIPA